MAEQHSLVADLILEGGGVKGNALAGAAAAFQDAGFRFNRLAGTSVGSMAAAGLASGISARAMHERMLAIDYTRFRDPTRLEGAHLGRIGSALSEMFTEGRYRGDALHHFVAGWLQEAGVHTFGDIRLDDPGLDPNTPDDQRYRVVMVASDVTRQLMVRIPWDLRRVYGVDPAAFPVADAVRISTAIPFFYRPVVVRSALTAQDSYLVDGGLTTTFPVSIFDRTDGHPPRFPTFRIGLATARPPNERATEFSGPRGFLNAVVQTALHGRVNAERDEPAIATHTIAIDTSYVGTTDFTIDVPTRQRLFDGGYAAAQKFLDTFDFTPYPQLHAAGRGSASVAAP